MIKDFLSLTKFVLSFAVSLSALFAYIMAKGVLDFDAFIAFFAVLLISMGACALNEVQEYKDDAKMERTKNRPIASGRYSPMTGIIIGFILVVFALYIIYNLIGLTGVNLFLFSIIWYNIFYTPLKKKSALAVVPGAILGVIPPAVGWVTAQRSLLEPEFISLGLFYFIWQVPHFWLLVMLYYNDYKDAGFPTAMKLFGKASLQRVTYVWLVFTIFAGAYMVITFRVSNIVLIALLIATAIFAFLSSVELLKKDFDLKNARKIFYKINLSFLLTVIFVAIDVALKA